MPNNHHFAHISITHNQNKHKNLKYYKVRLSYTFLGFCFERVYELIWEREGDAMWMGYGWCCWWQWERHWRWFQAAKLAGKKLWVAVLFLCLAGSRDEGEGARFFLVPSSVKDLRDQFSNFWVLNGYIWQVKNGF